MGQVLPDFPSKHLPSSFAKPMEMWQKQRPVRLQTQWDRDGDVLLVLSVTTQMTWGWPREDQPLTQTAALDAFSFLFPSS